MATANPLPPIARWTYRDAKAAVDQSLTDDYRVNYLMLERKDFWQKGALWPGFRTGDPITDDALLANIRPQFVADDILGECQDNYANGLLGHEPSVMLDPLEPAGEDGVPSDEQREDAERKLRVLSAWWDKAELWDKMRQAIKRSRYAAMRSQPSRGRGDVRVWLPPAGLDRVLPAPGRPAGRRIPENLELADAFDRIEVDALEPSAALVYTDPLTRERAAVVIQGEPNTLSERVEVWTVEGRGEDAVTRLRVLTNEANANRTPATRVAADTATFGVALRGRLPVIEAHSDAVMTEPMRRLQSLLNLAVTILRSTIEMSGHKQRYLTNVEPPGMWLPTAPANSPPLDTWTDAKTRTTFYKHRVPWTLGANVIAELIGVKTKDAEGREIYGTPGVTIEEPTDPQFVTNAHERIQALIYQRQGQGHFATADEAQMSGVAYQQHRSQFETHLNNGRGAAEGLVRETLYVACAYAALMSVEAAEILERYRIVVNLHPHAGPITAEEQATAKSMKEGRIISAETAMSRAGVEDTAAEAAAIEEDPAQRADLSLKQATAAKAWVDAGTSYLAAALLSGMSDADAELFDTGMREADRRRAEEERQRQEAAARLARENPQPNPPGPRPVPDERPAA